MTGEMRYRVVSVYARQRTPVPYKFVTAPANVTPKRVTGSSLTFDRTTGHRISNDHHGNYSYRLVRYRVAGGEWQQVTGVEPEPEAVAS